MSESFPLANYGLPAPNSWQVARITNDLEPKDLIRTQRDVSSLILAAIQEEPEGKAAGTNSLANLRHYDGLRSKYNLWDKAVQRNLATVGLLKLDKLYKNNSLDELQPRHWGQYCSKADRTLIYNVVMSTLTPEARDTAEREDCNGLMVLNQLWRQWGSPNLSVIRQPASATSTTQSVLRTPTKRTFLGTRCVREAMRRCGERGESAIRSAIPRRDPIPDPIPEKTHGINTGEQTVRPV